VIYDIGFRVDSKSIESTLSKLQNEVNKIEESLSFNSAIDSFGSLVSSSHVLQDALTKATSVSGVSMVAFNAELQKAGMNAQDMLKTFAQTGATENFRTLTRTLGEASSSTLVLTDKIKEMQRVMGQSVKFRAAMAVQDFVLQQAQAAVSWVKNLNQALTDIQLVSEKSNEEMAAVFDTVIKKSKELKTSAQDYADAALIFYQQGIAEDEVIERTDITIKAARAAGEEVAQMSSELTAVWNTYHMVGDELGNAASVAAKLGADTAVDQAYISEAMQSSASAASQMGVSYNSLAAIIATVGSTTQQSASVVGNAYKTIFSRFEQLKSAGTDGEVTLGAISTQLKALGIDVLDASGDLRKLDDVIAETGSKWDQWSEKQQLAVAELVGGTRQYGQFLALMNNFSEYQSNLASADAETGTETLDKQFETASKAISVHAKEAGEAWKRAFGSEVNADLVNNILDTVKELGKLIEGIMKAMGGIPGLLAIIGVAMSKNLVKGAQTAATTIGNLLDPQMARQKQVTTLKNSKNELDTSKPEDVETGFIIDKQIEQIQWQDQINAAKARGTEADVEQLNKLQEQIRATNELHAATKMQVGELDEELTKVEAITQEEKNLKAVIETLHAASANSSETGAAPTLNPDEIEGIKASLSSVFGDIEDVQTAIDELSVDDMTNSFFNLNEIAKEFSRIVENPDEALKEIDSQIKSAEISMRELNETLDSMDTDEFEESFEEALEQEAKLKAETTRLRKEYESIQKLAGKSKLAEPFAKATKTIDAQNTAAKKYVQIQKDIDKTKPELDFASSISSLTQLSSGAILAGSSFVSLWKDIASGDASFSSVTGQIGAMVAGITMVVKNISDFGAKWSTMISGFSNGWSAITGALSRYNAIAQNFTVIQNTAKLATLANVAANGEEVASLGLVNAAKALGVTVSEGMTAAQLKEAISNAQVTSSTLAMSVAKALGITVTEGMTIAQLAAAAANIPFIATTIQATIAVWGFITALYSIPIIGQILLLITALVAALGLLWGALKIATAWQAKQAEKANENAQAMRDMAAAVEASETKMKGLTSAYEDAFKAGSDLTEQTKELKDAFLEQMEAMTSNEDDSLNVPLADRVRLQKEFNEALKSGDFSAYNAQLQEINDKLQAALVESSKIANKETMDVVDMTTNSQEKSMLGITSDSSAQDFIKGYEKAAETVGLLEEQLKQVKATYGEDSKEAKQLQKEVKKYNDLLKEQEGNYQAISKNQEGIKEAASSSYKEEIDIIKEKIKTDKSSYDTEAEQLALYDEMIAKAKELAAENGIDEDTAVAAMKEDLQSVLPLADQVMDKEAEIKAAGDAAALAVEAQQEQVWKGFGPLLGEWIAAGLGALKDILLAPFIDAWEGIKALWSGVTSLFDPQTWANAGQAVANAWNNAVSTVQGWGQAISEWWNGNGVTEADNQAEIDEARRVEEEKTKARIEAHEAWNDYLKSQKDPEITEVEAEELDIDPDVYTEYAKKVKEAATSSDLFADSLAEDEELLKTVTKAMIKTEHAINDMIDLQDDFNKEIENGIDNSEEEIKIFKKMNDALEDMLGLPIDTLSDSFSADNAELLGKALEGDIEAMETLIQLASQDILIQAGIDENATFTNLDGSVQNIFTYLDELGLSNYEIGASLDDTAAIEGLNNLMEQTGMTATEMEEYLQSIGWDPQIEPGEEIELSAEQAQTAKNNGYVDVPVPGSLTGETRRVKYEAFGDSWDGGSVKVKLPKIVSAKKVSSAKSKAKAATTATKQKAPTKTTPTQKSNEPAEPKTTKKADIEKGDVRERYKDVETSIEKIQKAAEDAGKAEENLWGPDKLKAMQKKQELLLKEASLQARLAAEAKDYMDQDRAAFEAGLTNGDYINYKTPIYDEEGFLENPEEILQGWQDVLDAAYKALPEEVTEEQQEAFDKTKDFVDAKVEELERLIETEEKYKEAINAATEALREIMVTKLDEIKAKQEQMLIPLEMEIKLLNYLEDQINRMSKSAERSGKFFDNLNRKIKNALNQSKEIYGVVGADDGSGGSGLLRSQQLLDNLRNEGVGEYFKNAMTEKAVGKGVSEESARAQAEAAWKKFQETGRIDAAIMETLQDQAESLLEINQSLYDELYSGWDYMIETFEEYMSDFDTYIGRYDAFQTRLENLTTVMNVFGKSTLRSGVALKNYYKQLEVAGEKLKALQLKEQAEQDELDRLKRLYDQAVDSENKTLINEAKANLEKQELAVAEAHDAILEETASFAELYVSLYEQAMDTILEDFQTKIFPLATSMENALESLSLEQEVQDFFLDSYQSAYQYDRLLNKIAEDTKDLTDAKALALYQEVQEEILDKQAAGELVTEKDVELMEKRLAIAKAQAEFEDARAAKNTMRLSRDASGNYSYVYSGDESEDSDAAQKLADAQYDYYTAAKEAAIGYGEEIRQLESDITNYIIERQKEKAKIATDDLEQLAKFQAETDANVARMTNLLDYKRDKFKEYNAAIGIDFDQTALGITGGYKSIDEEVDTFLKLIETELVPDMKEADGELRKDATEALKGIGVEVATLEKTIEKEYLKIKSEDDLLAKDIDQLYKDISTDMDLIEDEVADLQDRWVKEMQKIIDINEATYDSLVKVMRAINAGVDLDTDYASLYLETGDESYLEKGYAKIDILNMEDQFAVEGKKYDSRQTMKESVEVFGLHSQEVSDINQIMNWAATGDLTSLVNSSIDIKTLMNLVEASLGTSSELYQALQMARNYKIKGMDWTEEEKAAQMTQYRAEGGFIYDPQVQGTDRAPVMATPGEFVLTPEQYQEMVDNYKMLLQLQVEKQKINISDLESKFADFKDNTAQEQSIIINADFPNVSAAAEIEMALINLKNQAIQRLGGA